MKNEEFDSLVSRVWTRRTDQKLARLPEPSWNSLFLRYEFSQDKPASDKEKIPGKRFRWVPLAAAFFAVLSLAVGLGFWLGPGISPERGGPLFRQEVAASVSEIFGDAYEASSAVGHLWDRESADSADPGTDDW